MTFPRRVALFLEDTRPVSKSNPARVSLSFPKTRVQTFLALRPIENNLPISPFQNPQFIVFNQKLQNFSVQIIDNRTQNRIVIDQKTPQDQDHSDYNSAIVLRDQ